MKRKCDRCGLEFDGYQTAKYCPTCRAQVNREQNRRCRESRRDEINAKRRHSYVPKRQPKPEVHQQSPKMTNGDIRLLLKCLRAVHEAGMSILFYGGQSFLTEEQLAVVEAKHPDPKQTLRVQREQKFFDAADEFVAIYRQFKGSHHD